MLLFLSKKNSMSEDMAYELYILRTVSGSAFNLLNKLCHISHRTFPSLNLGFPEADPETVHEALETVPRKHQQGCGQVGHEKWDMKSGTENHSEVYFMESNSGWVLGNCGDSVGCSSELSLSGTKQGSLRIYPHRNQLRTAPWEEVNFRAIQCWLYSLFHSQTEPTRSHILWSRLLS